MRKRRIELEQDSAKGDTEKGDGGEERELMGSFSPGGNDSLIADPPGDRAV